MFTNNAHEDASTVVTGCVFVWIYIMVVGSLCCHVSIRASQITGNHAPAGKSAAQQIQVNNK